MKKILSLSLKFAFAIDNFTPFLNSKLTFTNDKRMMPINAFLLDWLWLTIIYTFAATKIKSFRMAINSQFMGGYCTTRKQNIFVLFSPHMHRKVQRAASNKMNF